VRDAVKKALPKEAPQPGKFRMADEASAEPAAAEETAAAPAESTAAPAQEGA